MSHREASTFALAVYVVLMLSLFALLAVGIGWVVAKVNKPEIEQVSPK